MRIYDTFNVNANIKNTETSSSGNNDKYTVPHHYLLANSFLKRIKAVWAAE